MAAHVAVMYSEAGVVQVEYMPKHCDIIAFMVLPCSMSRSLLSEPQGQQRNLNMLEPARALQRRQPKARSALQATCTCTRPLTPKRNSCLLLSVHSPGGPFHRTILNQLQVTQVWQLTAPTSACLEDIQGSECRSPSLLHVQHRSKWAEWERVPIAMMTSVCPSH